MNKNCKSLTDQQLKVIQQIISSRSITAGVEQAGISRTTFYDWLNKNEAFKEEYDKQRRLVLDEGLTTLKLSANKAAHTLIDLLDAENEGVRLRTATAILDNINKSIEIDDIETRLNELERRLKQ